MRKHGLEIYFGLPLIALLAACGSDPPDMNGADSGANGGAGGTAGQGGTAGEGGSGGSGQAGAGQAGAGQAGAGQGGAVTDGGSGDAGNVGPLAVYVMSNSAAANQILGFRRDAAGMLTPMAAPFSTGGKGTGMGLGEQGALAFDLARNRIYTVNAGDNSFSIFSVNPDGSLGAATNVAAASADAGGRALLGPKSITFHGNTAYVLFQGDATTPSMIAGWILSTTGGALSAAPITGSALPLSSATQSVDPAQIEFSPDGSVLVVTEKQSGAMGSVMGAGNIDTFKVDAQGVASKMGFYPTASAGADAGLQMTPFGFEFLGNHLIVSEAGSTGAGSYTYAGGVIAPAAGPSQFLPTDPAPCWVAVTSKYAYVTNARGPNISGFIVDPATGGLSSIGPVANAVVASTGRTLMTDAGLAFQGPTDEFVSYDGQYLYVLNAAVPSIGIFRIKSDGTLARVGDADYTTTATSLPAGPVGIVAR